METPYVEIIFKGVVEDVKKFLADLGADLGDDFGPYFISEERGIADEGRVWKFLEAVKLVEDHTHALVPEKDLAAVAKRLGDTGIGIHAAHKVIEKRLQFEYECFNEELAAQIRALFDNPPAGVTIEGYNPNTFRDASAKGQELYTPAHDFECKGEGSAKGPVKALVEFRKTISEIPQIDVDDISLVLGDEVKIS